MSLSPPIFLDNGNHQIGYLAAAQATVIFPTEEYRIGSGPTNLLLKPYAQPNDSKIMYWGDDNNFPQMIIDLYAKDPLIPVTLGKMAASIIEGGLFACQVIDYNQDGSEVVKSIMDNKEINAFMNSIWFSRYLHETANDLVWFFNAFPGLILSMDRKKILQLDANEASYCRWSVQGADGKSPYVHMNANWPGVTSDDLLGKTFPVIDPYAYDPYTPVQKQGYFKYVYPISYPTPGRHFYQLAHHDSIRTSGWLDVHAAVPLFKKYLMKNQMSIKYHWKVDVAYWANAYGDAWTKATQAEKINIKKKWLKEMNDKLTDVTKSGNSILTDREWDKVTNGYKDFIEVITVEDPLKDGKYNEDSQQAAAYILYSIGVDPSTVGLITSMGGARSGGSDKREGWLIDKSRLAPFRNFITEPLHFAAQYNGWQEQYGGWLRFRWRDTILTTLDTGAGTKKIAS